MTEMLAIKLDLTVLSEKSMVACAFFKGLLIPRLTVV